MNLAQLDRVYVVDKYRWIVQDLKEPQSIQTKGMEKLSSLLHKQGTEAKTSEKPHTGCSYHRRR